MTLGRSHQYMISKIRAMDLANLSRRDPRSLSSHFGCRCTLMSFVDRDGRREKGGKRERERTPKVDRCIEAPRQTRHSSLRELNPRFSLCSPLPRWHTSPAAAARGRLASLRGRYAVVCSCASTSGTCTTGDGAPRECSGDGDGGGGA